MTTPKHDAAAGHEPSKRMTLSQVVEHLLTRGSAQSSSVTLTRNAKGETQIEVVIRTDAELAMPTPDDASATAQRIYDELRVKYPPLHDAGAGGAA